MFTKASERAWHSLSKMSHSEKVEKRRVTRRKRKAKEREEVFMIDYIRHKYCTVYNEAVWVCEQLNSKYPDKFDLRKAPEHKVWKIQDTTKPHPVFNSRQVLNMPPDVQFSVFHQPPANPQLTTAFEPPANPQLTTAFEPPANPQLTTAFEPPANPQLTTAFEPPANPQLTTAFEPPANPQLTTAFEPPANPQLTTAFEPPANPQLTTAFEPPANPQLTTAFEPPSSPEPPISPEAQSSPEPQASPEPPSNSQRREPKGKLPLCDNMQLIIPLIKPPVKQAGVTTETLKIITEEVIGEDKQPSLCEQIEPEVLEKIIEELRMDPDLQGIFADIEFQELGMELEIPEDCNMLETELENWEFW